MYNFVYLSSVGNKVCFAKWSEYEFVCNYFMNINEDWLVCKMLSLFCKLLEFNNYLTSPFQTHIQMICWSTRILLPPYIKYNMTPYCRFRTEKSIDEVNQQKSTYPLNCMFLCYGNVRSSFSAPGCVRFGHFSNLPCETFHAYIFVTQLFH